MGLRNPVAYNKDDQVSPLDRGNLLQAKSEPILPAGGLPDPRTRFVAMLKRVNIISNSKKIPGSLMLDVEES